MRRLLSYQLRKIATFIAKDDVPTEDAIHKRRKKLDELGVWEPPAQAPNPEISTSDQLPEELKSHPVRPKGKVPEPTARTWQKPPRSETEAQKEWSKDKEPQMRRDYMQQYRLKGEDKKTLSPKSKYVKK